MTENQAMHTPLNNEPPVRTGNKRHGGSLWGFVKSRVGRVVLVVLAIMLLTWIVPSLLQSTKRTTTAYEGVSEIVIENTTGGSVRVDGPTSNTSSVEVVRQYLTRQPSVVSTQENNRTLVKATCPSVAIGVCRANVVVQAPTGVTVKVTTDRGEIRSNGTLANLDFTAKSGTITIDRAVAAVRAQTSSGKITGSGIGANELTARTESGAITLPFSDTPRIVDAETKSGPITITVPRSPNPYKTDVTSTSGKVTLDVVKDQNAPWAIRANSREGDISVTTS